MKTVTKDKKEYEGRVWIRKSDGQIGIGWPDTFFGPIFFFKEHSKTEVLTPGFCQFLSDDGLTEKDFIDCGEF